MASAPSGATAMWWYIRIGTRVSRTAGRVGEGIGMKRVGVKSGVRFAGSSAVGVSTSGTRVAVAVAAGGGSAASGSTMSITAVMIGVAAGVSDDALAGAHAASRHSSPIHARSFFTALRFPHAIRPPLPRKKGYQQLL